MPKQYIKEELREDALHNYSRRGRYDEIDEVLETTWVPSHPYSMVTLLNQAGRLPICVAATTGFNTLHELPSTRGIRHIIHPAVDCRWCGQEYKEYPGKGGYCKQCHGPREGGMYG